MENWSGITRRVERKSSCRACVCGRRQGDQVRVIVRWCERESLGEGREVTGRIDEVGLCSERRQAPREGSGSSGSSGHEEGTGVDLIVVDVVAKGATGTTDRRESNWVDMRAMTGANICTLVGLCGNEPAAGLQYSILVRRAENTRSLTLTFITQSSSPCGCYDLAGRRFRPWEVWNRGRCPPPSPRNRRYPDPRRKMGFERQLLSQRYRSGIKHS